MNSTNTQKRSELTGRERMEAALAFQEPDRPPHFEMRFELTAEAFGKEFPNEEAMEAASGDQRHRLLQECVDLYSLIIDRFGWDAVIVSKPRTGPQLMQCIRMAKEAFGNRVMVGAFIWGAIHSIDTVQDYEQFAEDLYERPATIHAESRKMADSAIEQGIAIRDAGADFVTLASDVAFNQGPFLSPSMFREYVSPYLARIISALKNTGLRVILHSDGNLMPILSDLVEAGPHMFHSIDPMAGMDIAEVKRLTYGRVALMGNVQCNFLQDGPEDVIRDSANYALRHGSPGGGYVFSSSNTIFKGMPLRHYEVMLEELDAYAAKHSSGQAP